MDFFSKETRFFSDFGAKKNVSPVGKDMARSHKKNLAALFSASFQLLQFLLFAVNRVVR